MIRKATMEDYDECFVLAKMFVDKLSSINIDYDVFKKTWEMFINYGVVFVLEENNVIIGGFAGIIYNDLFDGTPTASELAWFVHPEKRGNGLKLLEAFEKWAKDNGCKKIIMIYMKESMPEILKSFYSNRGYKDLEAHFIKEV